jgi:hypothetical protein
MAANGVTDVVSDLMPTEDDLLYEEEVLRNPYSLRMWLRYIDARKDASDKRRFLLYERAIQKLPGSYKVRLLQSCPPISLEGSCFEFRRFQIFAHRKPWPGMVHAFMRHARDCFCKYCGPLVWMKAACI